MKWKIADQAVAWFVVLLGVVHCGFTANVLFHTFNLQALGFASVGLLQMLLGAVNLLRIQYAAARGVRTVCVIANVVMLAFVMAIAATLPLRSNPQAVVLVALIAAATVFSIVRRPERA